MLFSYLLVDFFLKREPQLCGPLVTLLFSELDFAPLEVDHLFLRHP
jgi:hypothetical protein